MSRIGKQIITVPAGVTVNLDGNNVLTVKGPKGQLSQAIVKEITVTIEGNEISFARPSDLGAHRALHGLSRALVANLVKGVTDGYEKKMELVGVGFKATNQGNILDLALGYSHNIIMEVPSELSVATEQVKGQNPKITISGIDKQLVGAVCAKIRGFRKPEPYTGKGVRFVGEIVRKKAGKSAGK